MGGEPEDFDLETVTRKVKERFEKVWKLQTVATFMTRLQKKGYISIYKVGRYSHYHPEVAPEEYRKERLIEMIDVLFDGDVQQVKMMLKEIGE